MSMKLATVFLSNKIFQRKQSSWFWILTNGTHDWLRLCGFSNYAKIRVSSWNILKITLHRVTTIWLIFSSENLHALDNNTLEQRIPRHIVLIWNLQLCVTAITFFLFSVNFFPSRVQEGLITGSLNGSSNIIFDKIVRNYHHLSTKLLSVIYDLRTFQSMVLISFSHSRRANMSDNQTRERLAPGAGIGENGWHSS